MEVWQETKENNKLNYFTCEAVFAGLNYHSWWSSCLTWRNTTEFAFRLRLQPENKTCWSWLNWSEWNWLIMLHNCYTTWFLVHPQKLRVTQQLQTSAGVFTIPTRKMVIIFCIPYRTSFHHKIAVSAAGRRSDGGTLLVLENSRFTSCDRRRNISLSLLLGAEPYGFLPRRFSRDVPAKKNGGKWFLEVPFLLDLQQSKWEFHMLFICMSNPPEVICPEHSNHPIEIIFSWHHPLSKIPLHFPLLVTLPNTLNHQGLQYVTYDQNHNPSLIQWSPESMGDRWVTQKEGEMPEIGWVCNHTVMKMVIWFWPSINSMPTTGSLGSV